MENRRCQLPQQPNAQAQGASTGPQSTMPQSPLLSGASSLISLTQTEEFFDLIASSQSRRLDDQRASIGDRLGIRIAQNNVEHLCEACSPREPSDEFFNMLIKYQVTVVTEIQYQMQDVQMLFTLTFLKGPLFACCKLYHLSPPPVLQDQ